MITTEEEAKLKRCQESFPAASGLSSDGAAYATGWHYPPPPMGNGMVGTAVHTAPVNCIASACMAWRWHQRSTKAFYSQIVPLPEDVDKHIAKGWERDPNHIGGLRILTPAREGCGYCGKAGKP